MRASGRIIPVLCLCAAVVSPQTPANKRQDQRLRQELKSAYSKWTDQDAAYIITDVERSAFNGLHNDEEREQFIEEFWGRRDPTPDTEENEFKEEHYRRIAYANEHFSSGMPGWKTDRGRIYIVFGPPDEIESHPSGGAYQRTINEGGGSTATFPFERWRYRYLADVGTNVELEFVDPTMSGEYHMTIDPNEKDALQKVPGHQPPQPPNLASNNRFTLIELQHNVFKPPRMPEILTSARSAISYNILPFRVQVNYFPLTEASTLTLISVQLENKDLQFQASEGVMKANVDLAGGVTTITDRNVATFEDHLRVDAPAALLSATTQRRSIYSKSLILAPGAFRLQVVAKDLIAGNTGLSAVALDVPRQDAENPQISSIVFADLIERVPNRSVGTGQFVIGDYKVRPRMDGIFRADEKLGVFFRISNMPAGNVEFEIVEKSTNRVVSQRSQDVQATVHEFFDLAGFAPGQYVLRVKLGGKLMGSAAFQVRN